MSALSKKAVCDCWAMGEYSQTIEGGKPRVSSYPATVSSPLDDRKTCHPAGTVRWSAIPEALDGIDVLCPFGLVTDAESLGRRETQYADLALVGVLVHLVRGLTDLFHRIGPRQRGMHEPF